MRWGQIKPFLQEGPCQKGWLPVSVVEPVLTPTHTSPHLKLGGPKDKIEDPRDHGFWNLAVLGP